MSLQLYIKSGSRYKPASRAIVTETAANYLDHDINGQALTQDFMAAKFLQPRMEKLERENFGVLFLDSQHRVIEFRILFQGTIAQAAVYPREIIKHALAVNAAAIIIAHNHPSGCSDPSASDQHITQDIKIAADLMDIRLLDHLVLGRDSYQSFSQLGLL